MIEGKSEKKRCLITCGRDSAGFVVHLVEAALKSQTWDKIVVFNSHSKIAFQSKQIKVIQGDLYDIDQVERFDQILQCCLHLWII